MTDQDFTKALLASQETLGAYARKLTKHTERGEDLLQDTNVRIWEKRSLYVEGNFLGWCKTLMKRYFLNQLVVENRMLYSDNGFINDGENEERLDNGMHYKHAQYLSQRENQEDYWLENRIHEVIASLEPHTAMLIQLKLQGMDYGKIAKLLGIKPNNAKQRCFNDLKVLRQKLLDAGLLDN